MVTRAAHAAGVLAGVVAAAVLACGPALAEEDVYETYVKTSKDFKPVRQDKEWLYKQYPSWAYMPWTFQWTPGYTDESGRWSLENGYNGAFIDRGNTGRGKLDWINRFNLRFYMDHTAAKGYLHLWDGDGMKPYASQVHGNGIRIKPVNADMARTLQGILRQTIGAVKSSPCRAAYALDDEISWGHFVHPCMWQVTDDENAFPNWLKEVYGPAGAPARSGWITYNDILPKLKGWSIAEFDAGPLMDQWSFNDSYWNNFLGDLVEYANSIDPEVPVGYVGGQAPSAFGGYDYAKLMRKIQFLEAYNIGGSQAIVRSFNPHNAMPTVTTHFHKGVADTVWQTWYYLAQGNRGFIGWVEKWFTGSPDVKPDMTPAQRLDAVRKAAQPWHAEVAPTYLEAGGRIGPLMSGAEFIHDGVALYYSHPSIQLGWILDAEAHGRTWINRGGDARLGGSHHVRHAWVNMLRDSGLQFNYLSYADVIRSGVPGAYKVLILPACLALSDAEARRIKEFCKAGGTVIADYMPGLWDQHGKGRAKGGALDDLFGVRHDPETRAADVFGGALWCEVDQDANFRWKTYEGFLTNRNACIRDATGYNKAVRKMDVVKVSKFGSGTAVLMNLSPQWYNAYRVQGIESARKRDVFIQHVTAAGPKRWVDIKNADGKVFGYEITYWQKAGRTIMFVIANPEISVSSEGGGNAVGLKTGTAAITLEFAKAVQGARDERTGKELGDGREFKFDWTMNEAVVISFAGAPPR
jgi:hypothetical protein